MLWADLQILVRHQANWLQTSHWHIELRCEQRLPVTETGYLSIFVPQAKFADEAAIDAFVSDLLDEAAESRAWQTYLEDSRQLKLF